MKAVFFNHTPEEHFIGSQFAEIYKDRIYHHFLRGRKDLTIFDLGAHIGIFSLYTYKYAKVIHAFEPAREHFECLDKMREFNQMDKLIVHQQAIALTPGEVVLHHANNVTAHSLNPIVQGGMTGLEDEVVQAVTIEEALKDVDTVDFMKMDIEGEEANVLGGEAFHNVAPKIREMVVEFHPWNVKSPMQLVTTLSDRGFLVRPISNQDASLYHAKRA